MDPQFILDQIENIKKWEGEAYQTFDEVGRAVFEIEQSAKAEIYNKPKTN